MTTTYLPYELRQQIMLLPEAQQDWVLEGIWPTTLATFVDSLDLSVFHAHYA